MYTIATTTRRYLSFVQNNIEQNIIMYVIATTPRRYLILYKNNVEQNI